jgi:hypothetical protein
MTRVFLSALPTAGCPASWDRHNAGREYGSYRRWTRAVGVARGLNAVQVPARAGPSSSGTARYTAGVLATAQSIRGIERQSTLSATAPTVAHGWPTWR